MRRTTPPRRRAGRVWLSLEHGGGGARPATVPAPPPAVPALDGLYVAQSVAGSQRAIIARDGRVLLDLTYDPDVLGDDVLSEIHRMVYRSPPPRPAASRPTLTLGLQED